MSLRPRAHIHLQNIVKNWQTINESTGASQTAAVVKADAYGHGLERVVQALFEAGCDHFFVAHTFEAEIVRWTLGSVPQIFVLNGPAPDEEALYRKLALTAVVNSPGQFQTLVEWLNGSGKLPAGYALHFDTGMHRLGLSVDDAKTISNATQALKPSLIMSHFSCAEAIDQSLSKEQIARFSKIEHLFPDIPVSLSNSAATALGTDANRNLIRPGYGLYGGGGQATGLNLLPAMTLEAPILTVQTVPAGCGIGYGCTDAAPTERLIATVALGYGDGFPRSASHKGHAIIEETKCPIVGRVSMDLITIDVSNIPALARPGVFAQFMGEAIPMDEQAASIGTIGYELTTGLTPRVERIYHA